MPGVKKELYNGIPNVTLWQVLRKLLHLNVYKLSIVQHVEQWTGTLSVAGIHWNNLMLMPESIMHFAMTENITISLPQNFFLLIFNILNDG
jgi:hypothetical protein